MTTPRRQHQPPCALGWTNKNESVFLWPLYGIGQAIIFSSCDFYSSLFTLMVETIQQYNRKYKKEKTP